MTRKNDPRPARSLTGRLRDGRAAQVASRQGSTGKWDCICGYQGTSTQDLDEHCIAMAGADDAEDHAAAN